jgi:magnesium-protoporphyrin O-methyltransferase
MSCCQCHGIDTHFHQQRVYKKLIAYRKNGPDATVRILLDALRAAGVSGMTLLDIGGGVGVLQHELLQAGVVSACHVEVSAASIAAAQDEAARLGYSARVTHHYGDFVALAAQLPPADIVTLDRVICCYQDMPALVELSAARARRLYGVVYPHDAWWEQMESVWLNLRYRIRRDSFRFYVHSTAAIKSKIERSGLTLLSERKTKRWHIALYGR